MGGLWKMTNGRVLEDDGWESLDDDAMMPDDDALQPHKRD